MVNVIYKCYFDISNPMLSSILLQPSVAFNLDFNQNLVLCRMQLILGG